MFLAVMYSLLACFMVSPVLRVSSWKHPAWCLPSLGYSPPSFTNFIIQVQAPRFCQGNLFRPALPASLLPADNSLPSNPCFTSIHLRCPEFSWLSQPSVSPWESLSTFSPNRTCQTFFLDSSHDLSALDAYVLCVLSAVPLLKLGLPSRPLVVPQSLPVEIWAP